ncbi:MAG: Ldh family oxidoreductase [Pseudomonadota bacterium]
MAPTQILSLAEIEDLSLRALLAAGTAEENALPLARATAQTEAEGVSSHGLAYIPIYCAHVACGKVDGAAHPKLTHPNPSLLRCDAATGFAHSAIDLGFEHLIPLARSQGLAGLAIHNSYNCGVLGVHTGRLAREGLLALGFTNAPASIAPSGGARPVVGTNPISVAAPGADGTPAILIDQSASTIAKSEVMAHAREGKAIPLGWALDATGTPTTDAQAGLAGSMAPSGGYKGVGLALVVEMMAAALSGASLGLDASPFSGTAGGPPKTGQFFIAIDPGPTSAGQFQGLVARLVDEIRAQEGARVPGDGRAKHLAQAQTQGVAVSTATLEKINALL